MRSADKCEGFIALYRYLLIALFVLCGRGFGAGKNPAPELTRLTALDRSTDTASMAESETINVPLKQWLEKVSCPQYYSNFVENDISLDLLADLDSEALKEIGVSRVGDRLRIEMEISRAKVPTLMEGPQVKSLLETLRTQISAAVASAKIAPATQILSPGSDSGLVSPDVPQTPKSLAGETSAGQKDSSKYVSFILSDGSIKRVNVIGCFNGPSIKRKVMRKLGLKQSEEGSFDTYTYTPTSSSGGEFANPARFETRPDGTIAGVNILSDVELVTVCYSPERLEKHRIILCAKNQRPSKSAIETSVRMMIKHGEKFDAKKSGHLSSVNNVRTERMRDFFGQRPPSELISLNLAEYFPHAQQKQLEATVRNSVRFSVRVPRNPPFAPPHDHDLDPHTLGRLSIRGLPSILSGGERSSFASGRRTSGRTIGDVMISNVAALDEAVGGNDILSDTRSMHTAVSRLSRPALLIASNHDASSGSDKGSHRYSRIELLNVDTDSEEDSNRSALSADKSQEGDAKGASTKDAERRNEFSSLDDLFDSDGPINWLKGARIGAGTFGTVYLGMNPTTGELMAVKQIKLPTEDSTSEMQQLVMDQQREMHLLKELNHENIVRYFGATTSDGYFNIFLEYVPGGSVLSMLTSYGPFEEPLIRNFVQQVLIGLNYLHGENIIHRDIKGANILIDIKGTVKIGDFGISKRVNAGEEEEEQDQLSRPRRRASLQGLVFWMAPEVVKQVAYTKKADIWLVGALIIEMFTGSHPFPQLNHMQAIFKLGTLVCPEIPHWCTAEATDFLSKTFEIDYEKRPNAVTLLSDPFLNPLLLSRAQNLNSGGD